MAVILKARSSFPSLLRHLSSLARPSPSEAADPQSKQAQAAFRDLLRSRIASLGPVKPKAPKFKVANEILSFVGDFTPEHKELITKMTNQPMTHGKRSKSRSIIYKTFHRIARSDRDISQVVAGAIDNVKPACQVIKRRVGGSMFDVPGIVSENRQRYLALRWVFMAAAKRREGSKLGFEKHLYSEILDAYRKRGVSVKKKETLLAVAAANRSLAHFRWW